MTFTLSIIIKTFNEQDKIASCIESVLAAAARYDHEVILADCISTDKTIEISSKYPIKIVQLANTSDRSCGAGAQLGYQHAKGDYILLIDGDMELNDYFIPEAIKLFQKDATLAGVGGLIIDKTVLSLEEKYRADLYSRIKEPLDVNYLGGGGIYRKSCIQTVRYFSHSGLAACEELELGIRLKSKGYRLKRIPISFSYHKGYRESPIETIKRKWRNGRMAAHGHFLKSSFGKPWFGLSVKNTWYIFVPPVTLAFGASLWWITESLEIAAFSFTFSWLLLAAVQSTRKKSFSAAFWALASWWVLFFACLKPIISKTKHPDINIDSKVLKA